MRSLLLSKFLYDLKDGFSMKSGFIFYFVLKFESVIRISSIFEKLYGWYSNGLKLLSMTKVVSTNVKAVSVFEMSELC